MVVRIVLIATTFGTNDALFWMTWLRVVKQFGVSGAYARSAMVNHPPLALGFILGVDWISRATGLAFVDVFRLFQTVADAISAFALFRLESRRFALFVLLSPAAAFVSAFHCNTDPLMIALSVLAAALALTGREGWAGFTLALAAGVKVVPFLFLPLFFIALPRTRRFLVAFSATTAAIFAGPLIAGGPIAVRHIFGYAGGLPHEWGFAGLAFAISRNFRPMRSAGQAAMIAYATYGRFVVYAAIIAVIILASRRSVPLVHAMAIMVLAVLAFAPGFGVQYMAWLIPLLPFALPWRGAIAVNAAGSVFLFVTYTIWSGGFPWWFADLARRGPFRFVAALAGYAMWLVVCLALIEAVRATRRSQTAERMPTEALQPLPGND